MPVVTGVLETSLYVDDLPRATRFYEELFGFERLFADERMCALSVAGRQVLLLFLRRASLTMSSLPHDGEGPLHLAFAVEAAELAAWEARLEAQSVAIERTIAWAAGGTSHYFRDPDGHLVEIASPGVWAIY
jgi:catechol 2,3-dioxygenase-like lactoylglutathione lyase family enzyme